MAMLTGVSVIKGMKNSRQLSLTAFMEGKQCVPAKLSSLSLNGIIFGELQEDNPEEIKPEREVFSELHRLLQLCIKTGSFTANFIDALLTDAKFENLFCFMFSFERATLINASFKSSVLTGANFNHANMQHADLSFCYGASCEWRGMGKQLAIFPFVQGNRQSIIDEDSFKLTNLFFKSNLFYANLSRSNFSEGLFHCTTLDHANLYDGIFAGATFRGCSMQQAILCMADFSNAKFPDSENCTNLSGANALGAIFTKADFTGANLQKIILTKANMIGAVFTNANMKEARLNEAHFHLEQFTRDQVLSFHYEDKNARAYINAIYDYMEQNKEFFHTEGFKRARLLITSFIDNDPYVDGKNKLLAGFLLTGKLPGEGGYSLFSSSKTNENSLRARLAAVQETIEELNNPMTFHAPKTGKR